MGLTFSTLREFERWPIVLGEVRAVTEKSEKNVKMSKIGKMGASLARDGEVRVDGCCCSFAMFV